MEGAAKLPDARAQKYVENVYYHELAQCAAACGYTIVNSARGDFRLVGISPELRERFSKRHRRDRRADACSSSAEHPEKSGGNISDIREHWRTKPSLPQDA